MRRLLIAAGMAWLAFTFGVVPSTGGDRQIDVGGHRLHVRILGEGAPTVVLEAGMAESVDTWGDLPGRIAETTAVVAYDRAGLGESELGPEPRDSLTVARDLHALLDGVDATPPYILVGHSLGGLFIRAFAHLHENEVGALVFLDATTEDMHQSLKTEEGRQDVMRQLEAESEGVRAEARAVPASLEQIGEIGAPPNVPAVVISAMAPISIPEEYRQEAAAAGMSEQRLEALQQRKFQLHARLAAQLPQGEHLVAEASHHFVHQDEPDLVLAEIERLVERLRKAVPTVGH